MWHTLSVNVFYSHLRAQNVKVNLKCLGLFLVELGHIPELMNANVWNGWINRLCGRIVFRKIKTTAE